MNNLKENIVQSMQFLDENLQLNYIMRKYSTYLLYIFSVIFGYILASIFRKNPLNEYLNFFKSSVKTQQKVENKIYLLTQINTMLTWSLFLFPLLVVGIFFVINSFFFEQEQTWINFTRLLKDEQSNNLLLIIFIGGMIVLFLVKKIVLVVRRSY